jgi:protein-S-isoprenylcysteine O-methyltransferase Ste14
LEAISSRDQKYARTYSLLTVVATAVWWIVMFTVPEWRRPFLGGFEKGFLPLFVSDCFIFVILPLHITQLLKRDQKQAIWQLVVHAVCVCCSFLISVAITLSDPKAYWGLIAMFFSSGTAMALSIRLARVNILWGPFQFKASSDDDPKRLARRTILQSILMSCVFVIVIPKLIIFVEKWAKLDQHHWSTGSVFAMTLLTMTLIWSYKTGETMAANGNGTPLPSQGAKRLVTIGVYRYIRNPMAVLGVSQGIAAGLIGGSPLVISYAIMGGIWWEILVRPLEEEHLEKTFGEEYLAYKAKVPCWWIRLRS